ncbi:MAG: response regulator [Gammaproteobacteria bacterium]
MAYPIALFHPTSVLMVDDELGFLQNMVLDLPQDLPVRITDSPATLISEVAHLGDGLAIPNRGQRRPCVDSPLFDGLEGRLRDSGRFRTASVVVADYDMPGMNGLELAASLRSTGVGIILLTGKADERIAVEAFNDGRIQRYVNKGSPDLGERLAGYIRQLHENHMASQAQMFQALSRTPWPTFTRDPAIFAHMAELRREHPITEWYASARPPGFILLDADGQMSRLLVISESELRTHLEVCEGEDAPAALMEALASGEVAPLFPTTDGYYHRGLENWSDALLTAHTVTGIERYRVCMVRGDISLGPCDGHISGLNTFLAHMDEQGLEIPDDDA